MKATEKIKLMMRLEKGFQKLDFKELHMIKDTLNKEIDNKTKLLFRGEKLHKAVTERELKKPSRWWIEFTLRWIFLFQLVTQAYAFSV